MVIKGDMHVHSVFSEDAEDEIDCICRKAIDQGLDYICFTEHYDMNPNDPGYEYFDFKAFSKAINKVRYKFNDEITILKGLEFGEPHLYKKEFKFMKKQDFDVILASVHWIDDKFVGADELLELYTKKDLFKKYYEIMMETVEMGGFDILAHIDFPKRYLKEADEEISLIETILKQIIEKDIALEINTSPLRRGLKETMPDYSLLSRYVKLGGEKITVGSDAHAPDEVASNFEYVKDLIKEFRELKVGIYRNHEFVLL